MRFFISLLSTNGCLLFFVANTFNLESASKPVINLDINSVIKMVKEISSDYDTEKSETENR